MNKGKQRVTKDRKSWRTTDRKSWRTIITDVLKPKETGETASNLRNKLA